MKHIDIMSAIKVLCPNANCIIHGNKYEGIDKWDDGGKDMPNKAEIDAEIIRQEAEWTAQAYSRSRQAEYPDYGTQLNKIYDDGLTKWKSETVDPVKAKWPKDNSGPK